MCMYIYKGDNRESTHVCFIRVITERAPMFAFIRVITESTHESLIEGLFVFI